jgi:uncharacterized protein (DUF697 family)
MTNYSWKTGSSGDFAESSLTNAAHAKISGAGSIIAPAVATTITYAPPPAITPELAPHH